MGKSKKEYQQQHGDALGMAHWSGSAYSTGQFSAVTSSPAVPTNKKSFFGGGGVSSSANSTKSPSTYVEAPLQPIDHDDLRQGSLYIIKIRNVALSLFEGWDDDMCCFAILRSDSTPMRWSEARYIPGDFDAYDAFDEAGNPPVHLWTRQLRINVPVNWFSIFEEARRKQRSWMEEQNEEYYYPVDQGLMYQQQHYQQQQPITAASPDSSPIHDHPDEDITPPATEKSASNGDKTSETSSHDNDEKDSITSESDGLARSTQDTPETKEDMPLTQTETVKEAKQQDPVPQEPSAIATNKKRNESKQEQQNSQPKQAQESLDSKNVPEPAVKTSEANNKSGKERTKDGNELVSSPMSHGAANETASVTSVSRSSVAATKYTVQKKEFADNVSPSAVLPQHPVTTATTTSPISSSSQLQPQHTLFAATAKRSSSLPKMRYQPGPPPSSASASDRLFGETDFSFSHNADQFAIKKGYEVPPLPTVLPPQPKASKKAAAVAQQQQSGEPLKAKRRSVHDLFRGKKDSRR